jgi:predicted DNA-binding transcriptional regulator AlpA
MSDLTPVTNIDELQALRDSAYAGIPPASEIEGLREQDVCKLVKLRPRTLQRRVAARQFPAPRRLGTAPNSPKVWLRHEVVRWLLSLPRSEGNAA